MKKIIIFVAVYLVLMILFFSCIVFVVNKSIKEINKTGMKNILNELWEGKENIE